MQGSTRCAARFKVTQELFLRNITALPRRTAGVQPVGAEIYHGQSHSGAGDGGSRAPFINSVKELIRSRSSRKAAYRAL